MTRAGVRVRPVDPNANLLESDLAGRLRQLADDVEAFQAAVITQSAQAGDASQTDLAESHDDERGLDWEPTPQPAPWLAPRNGRHDLESHVA